MEKKSAAILCKLAADFFAMHDKDSAFMASTRGLAGEGSHEPIVIGRIKIAGGIQTAWQHRQSAYLRQDTFDLNQYFLNLRG